MPVEIRELVIKTTISDKAPVDRGDRSGDRTTQDIINCCVEEVLKVLKREKER